MMDQSEYARLAEGIVKGAFSPGRSVPSPPLVECKTCDQVWRALFDDADLMFGNGVKRVDGEIVRLVCFGGTWDDRLLAQLRQVADLSRKCPSIREIRFVASRVTARGARLLKRLLPDATVVRISERRWMADSNWANPEFPE
jgi:hypothetical protein